jgi:hypothetical protein
MTDYGVNPYVEVQFGKYMSFANKDSFSQIMTNITLEEIREIIDHNGFNKLSFYLSVEDFMDIQTFLSSQNLEDYRFLIENEGKKYKNIVRYKRKLNVVTLNDDLVLFKKFNHNLFQIELETNNPLIISFCRKLGLYTKNNQSNKQNLVFPSDIVREIYN